MSGDIFRLPDLETKGLEFPDLNLDSPYTMIYGSAGSGKTWLVTDIATSGDGWLFVNALELIEACRNDCKTEEGVKALTNRLNFAPRLVIDDLALEQIDNFAKWKTVFNPIEIFRIALFRRADENYRTIITTNAKPEKIFERYDRAKSSRGRIASRFANHSRIYFLGGDRRKGEETRLSERTYIIENPEEKSPKRVDLTYQKRAAIALYLDPAAEARAADANAKPLSERDCKKALADAKGKGPLEQIVRDWIDSTPFGYLVNPRKKKKEAS